MRCTHRFSKIGEGVRVHPAHRVRQLRELVDELRRHSTGLAGPDARAGDGWRRAQRFRQLGDRLRCGSAIDRVISEGGFGGIVRGVQLFDQARRIWKRRLRPFQRCQPASKMLQRRRARWIAQRRALHVADDGAQLLGRAAHGDAVMLEYGEQQHGIGRRSHPA